MGRFVEFFLPKLETSRRTPPLDRRFEGVLELKIRACALVKLSAGFVYDLLRVPIPEVGPSRSLESVLSSSTATLTFAG
jgi:hypothetical protein